MALGINHWRQVAHEHGLDFDQVVLVRQQLQEMEQWELSWQREVRSAVWEMYNSAAWRGTARCSMKLKYLRAFKDGDRTLIPRFDECAQEMASQFPELHNNGDPAELLWEIIQEDAVDNVPIDVHWQEAIDLCICGEQVTQDEEIPF